MTKRLAVRKLLLDVRFWGIAAMFAACTLLRYVLKPWAAYAQAGALYSGSCVTTVLYLVPVTYAAFTFGNVGGIVALAGAFILMLLGLPYITTPASAFWVQTLTVVLVGSLSTLWLGRRRQEIVDKEQSFKELAAAKEQIQEYSDQIGRAHEEERQRIARELHDDTVQTMTLISRRLDTFLYGNRTVPVETAVRLEAMKKEIDNALVRMRAFVQDLRPPTLEHLGLASALRELVSHVRETCGIDVQLVLPETEVTLSQERSLLVYRIVQEALRNVCRHSGASHAEVRLSRRQDTVTVAIKDNGSGFEQERVLRLLGTRKLGLVGMKERARLLGGCVDVISSKSDGTLVALTVPEGHVQEVLKEGVR